MLDAEGELVPLDRQVIETVTSGELLSQQFQILMPTLKTLARKWRFLEAAGVSVYCSLAF